MQNTKDMFNMMDRNTIKMQKKYDNANYTMQIHCSHLVHRLTRDYKSKAQTTTMQNTIQIQYDYITNMIKIQWKYNAGRRERGQWLQERLQIWISDRQRRNEKYLQQTDLSQFHDLAFSPRHPFIENCPVLCVQLCISVATLDLSIYLIYFLKILSTILHSSHGGCC